MLKLVAQEKRVSGLDPLRRECWSMRQESRGGRGPWREEMRMIDLPHRIPLRDSGEVLLVWRERRIWGILVEVRE